MPENEPESSSNTKSNSTTAVKSKNSNKNSNNNNNNNENKRKKDLKKSQLKDVRELEDHIPYQKRSLLIAALAAAAAELITFPIDTTKIHLQLQHTRKYGKTGDIVKEYELGTHHVGTKDGHSHLMTRKSLGIKNFGLTIQSIYHKHGMKGFYKGWKPALIRASLNNALSATLYKPVRKAFGAEDRNCSLRVKLASGFTTGSLTQIIAAPTDLLKVRLQADNARPKPRYRGVFDAAISIYRRHGIGAFWKGLGPSMGRAGVAVASTFGTYDHVKSILLRNQFTDNFKTHTLSSLMAGFVATLVACPFDVVKTRYQSQSMTRPLYKSPTDCLKTIIEHEGTLTLWRGFWPMYSRLGPWQIMFFVTYETLSAEILGETF